VKTITIEEDLLGVKKQLQVDLKIEEPYSLTIKVKEEFKQEAVYRMKFESIQTPVSVDNNLLSQIILSIGTNSGYQIFTHPQFQFKQMISFDSSLSNLAILQLEPKTRPILLRKGSFSAKICIVNKDMIQKWRKDLVVKIFDEKS